MKNSKFIPVNEPLFYGPELKYLTKCIKSGWISSEGPFVEKFEKNFSAFVGRKYGVAVSSGTAALDIAMQSLNIKPGDEVILPSFTIISCINEIIRMGAKPVLVDSDYYNWNMNIHEVKNKITKKTKAILIVHTYGLPVELTEILKIAKKNNILIIEDSAEVIGQTYKGKYCGSFGDVSTVSFYPNKHITTGEGGMVLTNNKNICKKAKSLRNLSFGVNKRFIHRRLGWNYRMTNMQAAIGLAQLENIEKAITKKKSIGNLYHQYLKELDCFNLPINKTSYAENIYWVFGIVIKDKININAIDFINALKNKGIGTRPFFYPMHRQPVFKKMGLFKNEKYRIADKLYKKGFYIPSGLGIKKNQISTVTKAIKEILYEKNI